MKIMYLDESGDHNLVKIERDYPVFVLGGIIVEREYARTTLERELRAFKQDFFGRDDLILHTADIVRNTNGFEALADASVRHRFFQALNDLMRSLEYEVVACAIRKHDHLARYGVQAIDPYMLSLNVLVERFCFDLGDCTDGGLIVAEKRRNDLDDELEGAWMRIRRKGTQFQRGSVIDRRIVDLVLKKKQLGIAGLQLADLVVSPIGRHVLGKPDREDWSVVEEKFRRRGEEFLGPGLVVLPRAQ
jgi:hypothetical protein